MTLNYVKKKIIIIKYVTQQFLTRLVNYLFLTNSLVHNTYT